MSTIEGSTLEAGPQSFKLPGHLHVGIDHPSGLCSVYASLEINTAGRLVNKAKSVTEHARPATAQLCRYEDSRNLLQMTCNMS